MEDKLTQIQNMIYEIRGYQVMLDEDLAKIYQVETKRLNEAVKRNIDRFPLEFMFQLTQPEYENLRSQFATSSLKSQFMTSKDGYGGRRYLPFVFTEHGIIMLSSVLNSKIAAQVNIAIVRAFVQLRHYVLSQNTTNEQIADLRKLLMLYIETNDKRVNEIIIALNNLIEQPKKTRKIGFHRDEE